MLRPESRKEKSGSKSSGDQLCPVQAARQAETSLFCGLKHPWTCRVLCPGAWSGSNVAWSCLEGQCLASLGPPGVFCVPQPCSRLSLGCTTV